MAAQVRKISVAPMRGQKKHWAVAESSTLQMGFSTHDIKCVRKLSVGEANTA